MVSPGRIAVALHDVEPATFEKCALIRDWLADQGIDAVTLLVIPAADGHPFYQRSPALEAWLREQRDRGDAVAQHGFRHERATAGDPLRRARGGRAAEFAGLSPGEARDRVLAGHRLLTLAGLTPRGFVAPAYAYTLALRRALAPLFDWWAALIRCHGGGTSALLPAIGLGASGRMQRAVSPALLRAAAPLARTTLRLDLYPGDFDHPRHVLALERVLDQCRHRTPVTYDQLLAG